MPLPVHCSLRGLEKGGLLPQESVGVITSPLQERCKSTLSVEVTRSIWMPMSLPGSQGLPCTHKRGKWCSLQVPASVAHATDLHPIIPGCPRERESQRVLMCMGLSRYSHGSCQQWVSMHELDYPCNLKLQCYNPLTVLLVNYTL